MCAHTCTLTCTHTCTHMQAHTHMHGHVHTPSCLGFLSDWLAGRRCLLGLCGPRHDTSCQRPTGSGAQGNGRHEYCHQERAGTASPRPGQLSAGSQSTRLKRLGGSSSALAASAETGGAEAPAPTSSLLMRILTQECHFSDLPRIKSRCGFLAFQRVFFFKLFSTERTAVLTEKVLKLDRCLAAFEPR